MAGISTRVSLGLVIALLGASIASMLIPTAASADTNLIIGQQAVISYANGDQVRLRQTPEYEGTLIAMYDEGTYVTVLDGPLTDAAGNYWYQVSIDPNVGYIVADFLALENGVPLEAVAEATEEPVVEETPVDVPMAEVPTVTDPVAVVPEAPVSGAVIAFGWVAGTNGDGVRCRAAADPNAPVIAVLPEGTSIEITGPAFDIWQPINCMGGGGFVASQFVTTTDPTQAPVVTNPDGSTVGETPVAETPVASETPVVTNPDGSIATETPVETEAPVTEQPADVVSESAEPVILDESLVSGSAVVAGTNGDGVRCRARASSTSNTITIVVEGTSVQLTGVPTGVWQPVFCNGTAGYISNKYLGSGDAVSSTDGGAVSSTDGVTTLSVGADVSAAAISGSGMVSGTNGDGVRCRSSASYSGSIITVVSEGTSLSLRGIASGEWQPVVCAGSNGFVYSTYLSNSGSTSGGSTSGGSTSGSGDVGSTAVTGSATVNSAPGGLNCRTSGSMSGSVITVLSHGSTVSLRGSVSNGWQPVVCGGSNGFVSAQYLTSGGSTSGGGTSGGSTSGGGAASGSTLYVSGTGGGGVRLRSSASMNGSILSVVPEGASVSVRNGSTSDWTAVTYGGSNGFISASYLAKNGSTSGGSTSGGSTSGGSTSGLVNGDHAAASDALNLRYSASYSAGVAAVAPSGTVVLITGAVSNGFYPVDWAGLKGFMAGQYLTKTTAALSERGGSGNGSGTDDGTTGGSSSGGASGNSLVSYAMRYLGYPYVWATHGPSSFDCSGFTYWVVLNVLGRDIGAGTWTQVSAGSSVSRGNLQPGDLVFFQNTYAAGLSHVGMYIGNNQFIHAENESTGVRISDLNSSYYSSRWYGGVRLT